MFVKPDTKEILADAFKEQLKGRPFEQVTVGDIIELSGVSRTTFYRHFKDKYELMHWIYKRRVQSFIQQNPDISSWKRMLLDIMMFMRENQGFFENIVSFNGQNSFEDFLFDYGSAYCMRHLKEQMGVEMLPVKMLIAVKIYIAGTERVLFDWIRTGLKESPEDMTAQMCACMPVPMAEYFK